MKLLLPATNRDVLKSCTDNPFRVALHRDKPFDFILTKFLVDGGLDVNELYNEGDVRFGYVPHVSMFCSQEMHGQVATAYLE